MLNLSPEEIHLWFVFLEEIQDEDLFERYRQLLTEDERHTAARFYFPRDRRNYVITRALVRTVLSRYALIKPERWRFTRNGFGRPEIASSDMSFNISHTEGLMVLGVTCRHALGVDTENIRAREAFMDLADRFFSREEAAALRAQPLDVRQQRFFDYWTLKESYIKAQGKGFSIPLDKFSFDLQRESAIRVSFCGELEDLSSRWRFWQFRPSADHVAAVCVQREQSTRQRLVMRKIVPLETEELFESATIRQSESYSSDDELLYS